MLGVARFGPKRTACCGCSRRWYSADVPIVGCGSNVVDVFFKVRAMPVAGTKQYFANPHKVVEDTIVGGVTLNHLAWAALLGAPTGLLALQGDDDKGDMMRAKMLEMGVSTRHVVHGPHLATAQCHILLDDDGERAIIMAPAATSSIDAQVFEEHFGDAVRSSTIATTEISQVPLTGVLKLLDIARDSLTLTMLDVDVPPSVAAGDAQLGTLKEVLDCVANSDVIKPTLDAAAELLALEATGGESCDAEAAGITLKNGLDEVALQLQEAFGSRMVAVTDGKRGCGLAAVSESTGMCMVTTIPGFPGVNQTDSTGAGDAFFGGLVAAIYHNEGLPEDEDTLTLIGNTAAAAGAACCEVLGALPTEGCDSRMASFAPHIEPWLRIAAGDAADASADSAKSHAHVLEHSIAEDAKAVEELLAHVKNAEFGVGFHELCDVLCPSSGSMGRVLTTGVGKSGYVARRLAASLASVGIPSHFIHGTEWVHGDLGSAWSGDVVVILSHSGNTAEVKFLPDMLKRRGVSSAAIVGNKDSALAKNADIVVVAPADNELIGVVPTRSIIVQEVIANALLAEVVDRTDFDQMAFHHNHPGGNLGEVLKSLSNKEK